MADPAATEVGEAVHAVCCAFLRFFGEQVQQAVEELFAYLLVGIEAEDPVARGKGFGVIFLIGEALPVVVNESGAVLSAY